MGVVLSTLSFNKKNRRGDADDVTDSPLLISYHRRLPNMNGKDFPSKTGEPSMSSSIIETPVLNQDHNINQQHNVTDITTKLKIPKRAWSAYHLFHFSDTLKNDTIVNSPKLIKSPRIRPKSKENSEEDDDEDDDEPVEMEQLITMMQNHKLSDETSSFNFSFGAGNKNSANSSKILSIPPPPPPSPASQSSSRSNWSPSPEFKFSFSANIPQKNHSYEDHYADDDDLDFYKGNQQQNQAANNSDHHHVGHRKILPMPKPRWKNSSNSDSDSIKSQKSTTSNGSGTTKMFNNIPPSSNETQENKPDQPDHRDNSKKMKPSPDLNNIIQHPIVDNKRKERNWKDHFPTTAEVAEFSNHEFYALERSTVRFSSPLKQEVIVNHTNSPSLQTNATPSDTSAAKTPAPSSTTTIAAAVLTTTTIVKTTSTISAKKPAPKKKGGKTPSSSSSQTTYTKKKKNTNRKRSSKEEIAPGGFLSSDITLFENPISSDDWICLFCQYDILMHGFENTKKSKGFYRRKHEKNKRIKEAELRRLGGGLSESEEDHIEQHHTIHNHL